MEKSGIQQKNGFTLGYAGFALARAAMMVGSTLLSMHALWGAAAPNMVLPAIVAALAWLGWALGSLPKCGRALRWALRAAPWLLSFILGHGSCARGLLQLANGVITSWNTLHRGGLRGFSVNANGADVLTATLILAVLFAQILADMQLHRRIWSGVLLAGVLLLPQLLAGGISNWACALYLSGLLGVWMSLPGDRLLPQSMRTLNLCVVVLFACAALLPSQKMEGVEELRESITEQIHTARYGIESLPMGKVKKAAMLHAGSETMLTVSTEQEKDLYLVGFVGGEYTAETWLPLADSAYTGEYEGMLRWLRQNHFDPLTQSAQYYALCEGSTVEPNTISVITQNACRSVLYTPASAASVSGAKYKEKQDSTFAANALLGADQYRISEFSPPRPAELTVREEWVANPVTEEQSTYSQAEAVYRNFVYENYTAPAPELEPILNEMFWQDYDPEAAGIYSAVDRVRRVLQENTRYTETPATRDTNALKAFLQGRTAGNAVYYATAAVQALRAEGIPARYAEGYYASASEVAAAGGNLTLTGQNAHAWAEVYFDGVGWLPVDMTPGYYRDAVTLQQMIALPDAVHKTAALQDDAPGAEELMENADDTGAQTPDLPEAVWRMATIVLGVIALCLILGAAGLVLLELARSITWRQMLARYHNADPQQKALFLHNRLQRLLHIWGIENCLGWNTAETDADLVQKVPGVRPGEYTRAAQLLEKFLYGGLEPQPFELHTLEVLIAKLCDPQSMEKKRYLKMRYCHMINWFKKVQA